MIELRSIEKLYGNRLIIENVDFKVEENQMVAIKGMSGCGKTTLLNVLGLLDMPNKGIYLINGVNNNQNIFFLNKGKIDKIRNEFFGFVFQAYHLIEYLTVRENVELPLVFKKEKYIKEKVDSILEHLNISNISEQKVETLSGGEKQRVAIARAVVGNPKVIICDEPTGNLDKYNKKIVLGILRKLQVDLEISIIIVTHDDDVANYCDRRYLLENKHLTEVI